MGFISIVGTVFKGITGPLGVLEDWAKEPLKRWENERKEQKLNNDIERTIRKETGVESVKSDLRIKEANNNANLEIRMKTEINRINAETEQLAKDREFERLKNVSEAIVKYKEQLTNLQVNTIRAIGEMNIELREKAQDLISSKLREYKQLQDQAQKDAEEEFMRIIEKFSNNEKIMNIMITSADKKLASVIDGTSMIVALLNQDIQSMNKNIDKITQSGQVFIDKQLEQFYTKSTIKQEHLIEDAQAEEVE